MMNLAREQHEALTQMGHQETGPRACTKLVSSVEKAGPPVQSVRLHAFRGSARSQAGQVAPYALSEGQGALKPAEQRRKSKTQTVQAVITNLPTPWQPAGGPLTCATWHDAFPRTTL